MSVLTVLGLDKTFSHGVHPPTSKEDTRELPIRQFPFAPLLVIPLAFLASRSPARNIVRELPDVTCSSALFFSFISPVTYIRH